MTETQTPAERHATAAIELAGAVGNILADPDDHTDQQRVEWLTAAYCRYILARDTR